MRPRPDINSWKRLASYTARLCRLTVIHTAPCHSLNIHLGHEAALEPMPRSWCLHPCIRPSHLPGSTLLAPAYFSSKTDPRNPKSKHWTPTAKLYGLSAISETLARTPYAFILFDSSTSRSVSLDLPPKRQDPESLNSPRKSSLSRSRILRENCIGPLQVRGCGLLG